MKAYIIVSNTNKKVLEQEVSELLCKGYVLDGELNVVVVSDPNPNFNIFSTNDYRSKPVLIYSQPMIIEDEYNLE